eukprot:2567201-Amphidinium_carterae.1
MSISSLAHKRYSRMCTASLLVGILNWCMFNRLRRYSDSTETTCTQITTSAQLASRGSNYWGQATHRLFSWDPVAIVCAASRINAGPLPFKCALRNTYKLEQSAWLRLRSANLRT